MNLLGLKNSNCKNYFINGNPNNISYIEDHLKEFLNKFILNKKKNSKRSGYSS